MNLYKIKDKNWIKTIMSIKNKEVNWKQNFGLKEN